MKIPLLGSLLSASFYAQFCQTMANLLQNGLPLLTALKLMARATGNVFYRALVVRITDLVGEGASLTRAMKAVGHFPPNLRDLVKVGEQTGDLGPTLEKVGAALREDHPAAHRPDHVAGAADHHFRPWAYRGLAHRLVDAVGHLPGDARAAESSLIRFGEITRIKTPRGGERRHKAGSGKSPRNCLQNATFSIYAFCPARDRYARDSSSCFGLRLFGL